MPGVRWPSWPSFVTGSRRSWSTSGSSDKAAVASAPEVLAAVARAEAELGGSGRVLLRPSGTESLVRVMVEAGTTEEAQRIAERVAEVVAGV